MQPILLGLQASERETPQLLPQLMQVPFFEQVETDGQAWIWNGQELVPEDFLACGHIRLGLPIDTSIYHLLHRHCAKGARQAEAIIQLSQTVDYVKNHATNLLPALICSTVVLCSPSPPLHEKFRFESSSIAALTEKDEEKMDSVVQKVSRDSGVLIEQNTPDRNHLQPPKSPHYTERKGLQKTFRDTSGYSLVSCSDSHPSPTTSSSCLFSPLSSTSSLPLVHSVSVDAGGDRFKTIDEETAQSRDSLSPLPPGTPGRRRKTSLYHRPSFSGSETSEDATSYSTRLLFDRNQWNTTIVDNNTIVAKFGETTYPMLLWNPKLKLDFEISSPTGVPGIVVAVDPSKPVLNIRLHNPTSYRVGFSIRAYRQTTVHSSHVIYPQSGLHMLESSQCWEESADIHQDSPDRSEYVVVELFVAALEGKRPSWNVLRKYAVMKANKKRPSAGRPSRGNSVFQMPGTTEKKHDNLKQVIAHGLQCVVKNRHSAAEIIFTQALFLPDFQRIELKAFVYICLAVVAYRRQKAGEIESLTHSMNLVNSVDKLIDACEAPRNIRMPRTVQLVKQLRKELNFSDIVKNMRKKEHLKHRKLVPHYHTEGSTTLMCEEGGFLSHKTTNLLVPRGALRAQTEVTLSGHDQKQLQAMLLSTGWEKTVSIVCAVHIECETSAGRFRQPVQVRTTFPDHLLRKNLSLATSPLLLLHSNYLRKWDDVTQDASTSASISEGSVCITTDRTGWLAVAVVDLDPARIASMAMQSLSISPTTFQVCAFGQRFPDDVMQITVAVSPAKDGSAEESGQKDRNGPNQHKGAIDHTGISFPYHIQAYPGERIRCRLKGCFEPDANSGETDLDFHFKATQSHECLGGKFVRLTAPVSKCRGGKMVISRHVSSSSSDSEDWEDIADMSVHLSACTADRVNKTSQPANT